jgi:ribonuclease-3
MNATDPGEPDWPDPRGLQAALGYEFKSISLLETALRHASYANEVANEAADGSSRQPEAGVSNERLEFLGDSVLGLVVAHALYAAHPQWAEGKLTLALQNLVDQRSLAELGLELEIGCYLRLGRTERQSAGHRKPGILSDAVEAVLGAMYLDGGLAPVERLLRRVFASAFRTGAVPAQRDPKTRFQEWVMAQTGSFPVYECIGDNEIDGDENRFRVQVMMDGENWGEGTARSKRKAEQNAAMCALERVDREATD